MPATFSRTSANSKLSPVEFVPVEGTYRKARPMPRAPFCCNTYASIAATCSDRCPFKKGGCFANAGFMRIQVKKMDLAAKHFRFKPLEVAQHEAGLIDDAFPYGVPRDGARGGRDLRLHVSGDVLDAQSAQVLGGAASRWRERGGGTVWTFTHSWRAIARKAWGRISVLASVETKAQVHQAMRRGYAAAIVVNEFPNGDKAFDVGRGVKAIPCPAETRKTTCVECRLCLDRDLVKLKRAVAFKVHGLQADAARKALGGAR